MTRDELEQSYQKGEDESFAAWQRQLRKRWVKWFRRNGICPSCRGEGCPDCAAHRQRVADKMRMPKETDR